MADMTFKVNLLPNSDLGYSLGSSQKRWSIYGYSSNAISWDSTNKKLQQTVSSSGAADVLSFAAGDGINLTAAASSLTIAAKTNLKSTDNNISNSYYMLFSNTTDGSGKLYKNDLITISLPPTDTTSPLYSVTLKLGKQGMNSYFNIINKNNKFAIRASANENYASILIGESGPTNGTSADWYAGTLQLNSMFASYLLQGESQSSFSNMINYYLPGDDVSSTTRYLTYTTNNTASIGDSGMPVYAAANGELTACTKSDLQANIFVISDTAPADTSVIWLKPVSSSS